jgi:UDP-N-acetylglucosamine--N-acetylmuramyl-(pentapeptide) pyrophosphoryl-undecaprenol N-acetylglucosamine transferase
VSIELATDERASRYGGSFPARATHLIPSATIRGRNPLQLARTAAVLMGGTLRAWRLLGQIRPAAVIGFGGYPTIPPVMAGIVRGIPTLIHEQNGVMGRANRLLASRVTAIATSFPDVVRDKALITKVTRTGNPIRPAVAAAAAMAYSTPDPTGPLRLLVFGGSQGARIMADIVPSAIEALDAGIRARLSVVQQARDDDFERVRSAYARLDVKAEVAPFFPDLPARIAAAHLIVSRSGASTVAELAAIGRPGILVPLPHALDQDQLANARVLEKVGGAIVIQQKDFTPQHLAGEIGALAGAPARLGAMAVAAQSAGALDAAERLADLVCRTAGI